MRKHHLDDDDMRVESRRVESRRVESRLVESRRGPYDHKFSLLGVTIEASLDTRV